MKDITTLGETVFFTDDNTEAMEFTRYNLVTRNLDIKWKSPKKTTHSTLLYRYKNVSKEDFLSLFNAESIGKFLNSTIKPCHDFQKIAVHAI